MTQRDYTIVSRWNQSDPKSLSYAKNDPKIIRLAQLQVAPGLLMALLTPKKCRKYVFNLLMAPFGSDQSRHVDHFGAKKCNVDDFVAKKSSC